MKNFYNQMKEILGDEYTDFIEAISLPAVKAIRVNTLKISNKEFIDISPFQLTSTPLCENGFIVKDDTKLGLHPYYHAGLYYPQEPSAMAAISLFSKYIGHKVLDMCASPGGKSSHIACCLDSERDILVSNEIISSRCQTLLSTIERMGILNCMVTNNSPQQLQEIFPEYFDTVIVDAPCSGEGMFRKHSNAILHWSKEHVQSCSNRQYEILCSADLCLQQNGYMIYSTCTYNKTENEHVMEKFLSSHDYTHIPLNPPKNSGIKLSYLGGRLYPHLTDGEGQYIAILKKNNGDKNSKQYPMPYMDLSSNMSICLKTQIQQPLDLAIKGNLREFNNKIYIMPPLPYSPKLRMHRAGVLLCEAQKNILLPHHNLATTAKHFEVKNIVNLSSKDKMTSDFLRGETLEIPTNFMGFGVLCVDGFPLSIVKSTNGVIKNHYPKALRRA